MRYFSTFLALFFFLFLLSCQRNAQITNPPAQTESGSSVSFYFAKPAGLDSLVVSARALVSAPGIDSIRSDLAVNDTSVIGTIENIPAGPHRKFEIFTYDADTNLTYYGHEFADVAAGNVITVQVVLYPINTTGTVIIVGTFNQNPSPQGKIVFEANYTGMYDIYIMNADGSDIRNLTNSPNTDDLRPRISPNGQKVLFTRRYADGSHRPFVINPDGSGEQELNILPGFAIVLGDWSPDIQKMVLYAWDNSDPDIFIYDFASETATQLTFNTATDWMPRWSPEGDWISYHSDESGIFRNYLIRPGGMDKHLITPQISYLEEKYPSFSPDAAQILFYGRDNSSAWDLFMVDIDGNNLIRFTQTSSVNEHQGCFSPDGQKIVYVRNDGSMAGGLYIMNRDGSGIQKLLDTEYDEGYPCWR